MSLPSPLRTFTLAFLCLGAAHRIDAQEKTSPPVQGNAKVQAEEAERLEKAKAEQMMDSADGEAKGAVMPTRPTSMAPYAYPHVTTRPRRLAPGESGTLVVVLALQAQAVVVGDSSISLTYAAKQGVLELGTYNVVPAKPGTLETKFKGQLVHDNTLTVEVPLVVAADAKFGEAPVTLSLVASVANGASGAILGDLSMPIQGKVNVGRSVPKPLVRDDGSTATAAAPAAAPALTAVAPGVEEAADASKAPARSRATAVATNTDGVSLDVNLDRATLPLGETVTATVSVRVPAGLLIAREEGAGPVVEVLGADAGVSVEPGAWTPATVERAGDAEVKVSRGTLAVPVVLRADADAVPGLRRLEFRVAYRTPADAAGAPQRLVLPVVLSVGNDMAVATPSLFYIAGIALALLLVFIVVRAMRGQRA